MGSNPSSVSSWLDQVLRKSLTHSLVCLFIYKMALLILASQGFCEEEDGDIIHNNYTKHLPTTMYQVLIY